MRRAAFVAFLRVALFSGSLFCVGLGTSNLEATPIIFTDRDAFNAAVEANYGPGSRLLTFDEPTICAPPEPFAPVCRATYDGLLLFEMGQRFGGSSPLLNEPMPPYIPFGGIHTNFNILFEPAVAIGFDVYPTDVLGRTIPPGFEDPFFGTAVSVKVLDQIYVVSSPQFFGVLAPFSSPLTSLPVQEAPYCLPLFPDEPQCPPPNNFGLDNVAIKTVSSVVPEPATMSLLVLGAGFLAYLRRIAHRLTASEG